MTVLNPIEETASRANASEPVVCESEIASECDCCRTCCTDLVPFSIQKEKKAKSVCGHLTRKRCPPVKPLEQTEVRQAQTLDLGSKQHDSLICKLKSVINVGLLEKQA